VRRMRIDFPLRSHLQSNGRLESCHLGLRLQHATIPTTQNVTKLTKNGQTPFGPAPMGHGASMSLYDYCNGDPVNCFDPDGRYGKEPWKNPYPAPNNATSSTTTAGTQTVTYKIVTVIRPDDAQAGEKSRQTVTINPASGELVSNTHTTGHTVVPFFGNKLPSRSDSFTATSSPTPAGHRVTVTGETGSWLMPVNINYSFQIYYNTTTGSVSTRGAHDGYPSYEVWRGDVQVYDHHQQNLRQLGGSGDVNVKRNWTP